MSGMPPPTLSDLLMVYPELWWGPLVRLSTLGRELSTRWARWAAEFQSPPELPFRSATGQEPVSSLLNSLFELPNIILCISQWSPHNGPLQVGADAIRQTPQAFVNFGGRVVSSGAWWTSHKAAGHSVMVYKRAQCSLRIWPFVADCRHGLCARGPSQPGESPRHRDLRLQLRPEDCGQWRSQHVHSDPGQRDPAHWNCFQVSQQYGLR